MWQSKKVVIAAVLAAILLVGSIGGVALAQTGNGGQSGVSFAPTGSWNPAGGAFAQNIGDNVSQRSALFARVAKILGIDQQKVEDAFAQAQSEIRQEALDSYLQNLVKEGRITQEQADQYKAWLKSKPDMEPFRRQLEEWQQGRPDITLPGSSGRFGGHGFRGGMMWGGGRGF